MNKSGFMSLSVKFDEKFPANHELFVKQHKLKEESDDRPSDLTLFICNVPPYYTEDIIKNLFEQFGTITKVYFADIETPSVILNPNKQSYIFDSSDEMKGYKIAYVVFSSAKSLQKVFVENPSESMLCNVKYSVLTGLKKWIKQYNSNIFDSLKIAQEIDEFMMKYDAECLEKKEIEKSAAEPDDEGWITVTKKGRNPGFSRKQSTKDNITKAIKRKKRKKTLLNFYTFQIKESKMNHISKLREKFEEDKKKVETLKMQRKFKPF